MRTILIFVFTFMLLASECFAMNFTGFKGVGKISTPGPSAAFEFIGATMNNGKLLDDPKFKRYNNGRLYTNGIARFGEGKTALYVHYRRIVPANYMSKDYQENQCRLGSEQRENTVAFPVEYCAIYQITNDRDMPLYLLCPEAGDATRSSYILIGQRNNGAWVQFFDTRDVLGNYYNTRNVRRYVRDYSCENDIIKIEYRYYDIPSMKEIREGELRFKWDEKAQWFGVDQITY